MQHRHFPRSLPVSPFGARDGLKAFRWWALACLLPMLLMGLFNQALHQHEFDGAHHPARARQSGATSQQVAPGATSPSFEPQAAGAAPESQMEAAHPASALQNACLLCQWADATSACRVIGLVIWWPLLQLHPRPIAGRLRHFEAPLSLRARAPPQPSLSLRNARTRVAHSPRIPFCQQRNARDFGL